MDLILDTASFLSGRITSIPHGFDSVCITSRVRDEVMKGRPGKMMEDLLEIGLKVRDPIDMMRANKSAASTGDIDRLSETDISIIALAIEMENVLVLTDDFRIQNVLRSLDIRFQPAGEIGERTVKEVWNWTFRCRGCGRYFEEEPGQDCPICGSAIKHTRKRST